MGEDRLHVVFGTGQVGSALAAHLAGLGIAVRAVSRHRPPALAGVDWRAADAADPEAAADAAKGASVIYQCLNAPYNQWPERFPPLQRGVLAAAERTGALLVSLENLYGYGPTGGRPMTEDLPLAATGRQGPGPGGHDRRAAGRRRSWPGPHRHRAGLGLLRPRRHRRVHARRAGLRQRPGRPARRLHRQPRAAAHLQLRPRHRRRPGHPGHRRPRRRPGVAPARPGDRHHPGAAGPGGRQVGHPVGVRSLPKLAVRGLGLVNPMLRELAETYYQFGEPFVLDTSKYQAAFGAAGTPLADAIAATVAWYRARPGTP